MSYLGRSAKLSLKAQEKVSFLATAGQTSKTGLSYVPSFVEVYVNGILLTDTTDFTATNGNSVTFTVALALNDEVTVVSLKTFTVADHYTQAQADALLAAKATATTVYTKAEGDARYAETDISNTFNAFQTMAAGLSTNTLNVNAGLLVNPNNTASEIISSVVDIGGNIHLQERQVVGAYTDRTDLVVVTNTGYGVGESEKLRITAGGIVTKPYQPAFLVQPSTTQNNVAEGVDVVVVFGTERFDQNSNFSSNTFTAPVTGKYFLSYSLFFTAVDNIPTYFETYITTSNRTFAHTIDPRGFDTDPAYWTFNQAVICDMDAGDTAQIKLNIHNTGTVQSDITTYSYFSGYLVA